ncbi:MAG TPA: hypothetical protein VMF14_21565 [Solirubrobacteraceae bacterium]|nr:hypothetical protein [Solirubrobacteraceae bacterium]
MPVRAQAATRGVAIIVGLCALALAAPATGVAARLVGGHTQQAIARAFTAQRAHRGQVVVSIRTSTVNGAWAVVRSVTPQPAGQTRSGATPRLQSTYYHLVGGAVAPAPPPKAVRTDLMRDFQVAVVYAGTGSESIAYQQNYGSVCAGEGFFTDQESDAVSPMTWSVRYIVDLDALVSAVRDGGHTALLPAVRFDPAGSEVTATETIDRSVQDVGCNGRATTFRCTESFAAGGPDPGGQLSFPAGAGLEAGVPVAMRQQGACDPDDFTLGPSLWDNGAAAALAGPLKLMGGTLPAKPYAPVRVAWPAASADQAQGFAASPCQGDAEVCTDAFQWHGTVSLQPVTS